MLVAGTWIEVTLDNTFTFSNGIEVFVETNFTGGGGEGTTAKQFRWSAPSPAATRCQTWQADTNPPTGTGTTSSNRPNIQLVINQPPCPNPSALVATSITEASANISWSQSGCTHPGEYWVQTSVTPPIAGSGPQ